MALFFCESDLEDFFEVALFFSASSRGADACSALTLRTAAADGAARDNGEQAASIVDLEQFWLAVCARRKAGRVNMAGRLQ